MRGAGFVGDVVGHAGVEGEFGAVFMLDDDLAGDDEHDVALATPVVGDVFATVIHQAKLDIAELTDARGCGTGFAHVGRGREFGPIDGAHREIIEPHLGLQTITMLVMFARIYHRPKMNCWRGDWQRSSNRVP